MKARIILTTSDTSDPPGPPRSPSAGHAQYWTPATPGCCATLRPREPVLLLAVVSGRGLDLIRAVLEEVVFGAGLLWVRNHRREEDGLDLSIRIPVGGPASMIRVKD